MTERFMMKNRPPREPGFVYSLGFSIGKPDVKPKKPQFRDVTEEMKKKYSQLFSKKADN